MGVMFHGYSEQVLTSPIADKHRGKVQLIFTSPPFPLNRKKQYGNKVGDEYIEWVAGLSSLFKPFLTPTGSIVMEIGNSWTPGSPTMSTVSLEAMMAFLKRGGLHLCQQFVWSNPAKLPGPAEWVTIQRIRVKDSFTNIWWMSAVERPKADNRRVLQAYSSSMQKLISTKSRYTGTYPSGHVIDPGAFLTDHGGAIPPSVLSFSNTATSDPYQTYCREHNILRHPARMPAGLPEFFIKFLTDEGDIVMDPFAGSNTTGGVAENLKRRWIGIEPVETYLQGSKGRFQLTHSPEYVVAL